MPRSLDVSFRGEGRQRHVGGAYLLTVGSPDLGPGGDHHAAAYLPDAGHRGFRMEHISGADRPRVIKALLHVHDDRGARSWECILRGRDAGRQGHHHCECGWSDYIRVASLARGGTVAVRGIRVADRLRKFRNLDPADLVGCLRVTDPAVLFMTGWHGLASVSVVPIRGRIASI